MTPIWILIVATCLLPEGKSPSCTVDHGTKAFTTLEECQSYAKVNYNPAPECYQPLTIYHQGESKNE